ncbi:MAG TPA: hypothetical protein VFA15_05065, partial [Nitrososphaera sp.]|nr:hypothetical protein [Nitrososphaera sp.]
DPALASSSAEIKYTLRTLLRIAGYPYEFRWQDAGAAKGDLDIYYGREARDGDASVWIRASGRRFVEANTLKPRALVESDIVPCLVFDEEPREACRHVGGKIHFMCDVVLASYWLLTGAQEAHYRRDHHDNFYLDDSFFLASSLPTLPLVSIYGAFLRAHFQQLGEKAEPLPWGTSGKRAAFALTHDVDYPEIIRVVETLGLLRKRGLAGARSIRGVLDGTNHFWKFGDWVEFAKTRETRPAFYFMARKGSLLQYALGTPDAFYDIHSPRFRELFSYLRGEGCEIGVHASYHAYRSAETLRSEKLALEELAETPTPGTRHHYWHLDPVAPHETLYKQEQAGFLYDSSLEFEFYPGFRRGIAHPFRIFHPGERRELRLLELPPAWMDDQFDRRRKQNGIRDCQSYARRLVNVAQQTNGVVIVDYHQRGMNHDFYPRYGSWLMDFMERNLDSTLAFYTPLEIARQYSEYEMRLEARSRDLTATRATRAGGVA